MFSDGVRSAEKDEGGFIKESPRLSVSLPSRPPKELSKEEQAMEREYYDKRLAKKIDDARIAKEELRVMSLYGGEGDSEGFQKIHGREPTDEEREWGFGLTPEEGAFDRGLRDAGLRLRDLEGYVLGRLGPDKVAVLDQIKHRVEQEFGPVKPVEPIPTPSVTKTPQPSVT